MIDNMDLRNIILGLSTILVAANIFCQTNNMVAEFSKGADIYTRAFSLGQDKS